MKNCPNCGIVVADDCLFCTECGNPFPQGRVCQNCGATLNEGDIFCTNCGKKIEESPSIGMSETTQKICPHCGVCVGSDDVYCQNCGKKIDDKMECGGSSVPLTEISADVVAIPTNKNDNDEEPYIVYEEDSKSWGNRLLYFIGGIILVLALGVCIWNYYSSVQRIEQEKAMADSLETVRNDSIRQVRSDDTSTSEQDIKLINEWYEYVFCVKEVSDKSLNKFLSSEVKDRLLSEDYEGTYEFWRFRTTAQDFNPEVGDISEIENISAMGEGWYVVTYLDMGSKGKTKIKIDNNKIIDFIQDSSWYEAANAYDSIKDKGAETEMKSQEELARTNTAIGAFDVEGNDELEEKTGDLSTE